MNKKTTLFTFIVLFHLAVFGQDKLFLKDGSSLKVKITDRIDDKVMYKMWDDQSGSEKEIMTSKLELIKFADGKTESFEEVKEEKKSSSSGNTSAEFDRNDEKFVSYANAVCKEIGDKLMKKCAKNYQNARTEPMFDGIYKDQFTGEVSIPVKITWDNNWNTNERWIKGAIKVSSAGKKWDFTDSQGILFKSCAKDFDPNKN